MILDLIRGHSATGPTCPVDAQDFAGHPGDIKLNKTLSLPPSGMLESPKGNETATGIAVIPAGVWAQPGENSGAGSAEERPATCLALSLTAASLQGCGLPGTCSGSPLGFLLLVSNQPSTAWQQQQPPEMRQQPQGPCTDLGGGGAYEAREEVGWGSGGDTGGPSLARGSIVQWFGGWRSWYHPAGLALRARSQPVSPRTAAPGKWLSMRGPVLGS